VADRFRIGRTLQGALTSHVPVGQSLCAQARLGVVMRQQLRLRLGRVRKPLRQHLGKALMVLLPRAPEQRLIRGILDERMLKGIGCLWWYTSLVDNLRLDQPA
jgi:hypothetical protein